MIVNKKVVACYIRLSDEDEESEKGFKDESNSVTAQRQLINEYIENESDFKDYDIKEYVDDGYTGTNFKRPSYENLMEDAKRGDIGVVVVKDFSRLGRDHLETGNLLERIFPMLQIRFISVNDGYDSADCDGMTGGLNVALKNVMNAMYSRDLSGKVRTAMTTRAKNGQYIAAMTPYGYVKDPEDKHHLVVDEEAASVVRRIFTLAAEGYTKGWIASYLNDEGIPTPGEHLAIIGVRPNGRRNTENPRWTTTTISDMLHNEVYIGNVCWHKSDVNLNTGKKKVNNSREDWIVTENAHEAIVSREIFKEANRKAFTGKKKTSKKGKVCPLIYCAYCGRTLSSPTDGNHIKYRCMNGYGTFAEKDCSEVRIKGTDLEQAMLANVNKMAEIYAETIEKNKKSTSEVVILSDKVDALIKEQKRLSSKKMRLYEEYRSGGSREAYLKRKEETENRLAEVAEALKNLDIQLESARQNDIMSSDTKQIFADVMYMDSFDKERLKKIIDRVNVYGSDRIEIIWKPLDAVFQRISSGSGFVDL